MKVLNLGQNSISGMSPAQIQEIRDLSASISTDTAGLEDIKAGTIPAVTKLLAQSNIVATSMSDDTWAEHSYKWGGPSKVLAYTDGSSVFIRDVTQPSLPIIETIDSAHEISKAMAGSFGFQTNTTVSITLSGSLLIIGQSSTGTSYLGGLKIYDFATKQGFWFRKTNPAYPLVNSLVNSIDAIIPDNAPHHPVSGIPMPTISVATDGGGSVLKPNDSGEYTVENAGSSSYKNVGILGDRVFFTRKLDKIIDRYDIADTSVSKGSYLASDHVNAYQTINTLPGITSKFLAGETLISSNYEGLNVIHENPSDPTKGSVSHITKDYSTPLMIGGTHTALLCDGFEGVVSDTELITNGTFTAGLTGWSATSIDPVRGVIQDGGLYIQRKIGDPTSIEQQLAIPAYSILSFDIISGAGSVLINETDTVPVVAGRVEIAIISTLSSFRARCYADSDAVIDNISIKRALPDRSGNNNHRKLNGTLSFTKPTGSDIAVASGFSADNCIELEPIDVTQPFSITGANGSGGRITFCQSNPQGQSAYSQTSFAVIQNISTYIRANNAALHRTYNYTPDLITLNFTGTKIELWGDGLLIEEIVGSFSVVSGAKLLVGIRTYGSNYHDSGDKISQFLVSTTPQSSDQIRDLHRIMAFKMKHASMLKGEVVALAYDTEFKNRWVAEKLADNSHILRRFEDGVFLDESIIDPAIGVVNCLEIVEGTVAIGGSLKTSVYIPAKNLRETKVISAPKTQHKFLGEGGGPTGPVDFYLPRGWKPVRVEIDGIVKQKGPNKTWTLQFDGYRYFIRFKVAPGLFPISCLMQEVK